MKRKYFSFLCFLMIPLNLGFASSRAVKDANTLYKNGRYEEAVRVYEEELKKEKQDHAIYFNLGNAYFQKQAFDQAQDCYQKTGLSDKVDLQVLSSYSLGNCAFRKKQYPEALSLYKRAIEKDPKDLDAKFNYEVTLKKIEEAKKDHKEEKQKDQEKEKKDSDSKPENDQQKSESKRTQSQDQSAKNNTSEKTESSDQNTDEKNNEQKEENESKAASSDKEEQKTGDKNENNSSSSKTKSPEPQEHMEKGSEDQNFAQGEKGMKKEEALHILDVVNDEKKDLLWNILRSQPSTQRKEDKDW